MVIETREAAQDKAFELLDEIFELLDKTEDLDREKKMIICELKDTLYDCFESSKEEDREDEEKSDDNYGDVEYRKRGSYRYNRHYAMRDSMDDDMDDDVKMLAMRSYRRGSMRMRRSRDRMGRFN